MLRTIYSGHLKGKHNRESTLKAASIHTFHQDYRTDSLIQNYLWETAYLI